jgi:hypothetical protein
MAHCDLLSEGEKLQPSSKVGGSSRANKGKDVRCDGEVCEKFSAGLGKISNIHVGWVRGYLANVCLKSRDSIAPALLCTVIYLHRQADHGDQTDYYLYAILMTPRLYR